MLFGYRNKGRYLVMSFLIVQNTPDSVGSAVLVRRSSTPANQMAAIRSYWSPWEEIERVRRRWDHGEEQLGVFGGVYGAEVGGRL